MEVDRLEIRIQSEAQNAIAELDKLIAKLGLVQNALGKQTKGFTGLSDNIKTIGATTKSSVSSAIAGITKLGFAVRTLQRTFDYIGTAIKESMDFGENVNLFQTSMRSLGKKAGNEFAFLDKAEAFNKDLSSDLGLDSSEMMRYQGAFAQMTSSMGIAESTAYDLSESFTMLGADISSLWNLDLDVSMKKLQSALTGQVRGLRELGVDISMATMQEEAYALGINKSVTAMTQAEKTQLRYFMIMKGLTVAQGDMARTLESPANQLRILSQQFQQLTRAIGNAFLPMVTAVMPYINALVMGLRNLVQSLANLLGYKMPDFKFTPVEIFDSEDASGEVDDVTNSLKKMKSVTLGIDELNIISQDSGEAGAGGVSGSTIDLSKQIAEMNAKYKAMEQEITDKIGNRANDILESWNNTFSGMGDAVTNWGKRFAPAFESVKSAVSAVMPGVIDSFKSIGQSLGDLWNNTLAPMGEYIIFDWIPGIVNPIINTLAPVFTETAAAALESFAKVFDWSVGFINEQWNKLGKPVFELIKTMFEDVAKSMSAAWDKYGAPILDKAQTLISGLTETFQKLWDNILYPIVEPFLVALQTAWSNSIAPIIAQIQMLVGKAIDAALDIWNKFISPIVNYLITVLQPVAQAVGTVIGDVVTTVWEVIERICSAVIKALGGVIDFVAGVFTGDWERAWTGIKDIFGGIWDTITAIFTGAIELVSTVFESFATLFKGVWETLWTGIKDFFSWVWDGIKTAFDNVTNILKDALDNFTTAFKTVWMNFWKGIGNFFIDVWNGIVNGFEKAVNFVIDGINDLIEAVNSVSELVGVSFDYIANVRFGRVPELTIKGYASGGIPNYGELFLARENGIPEMVGQFGNNTGVANNQQIVDGIAAGVYEANSEQNVLLREQNTLLRAILEKNIGVYLDGKEITKKVEKIQKERGTTLLPGGVAFGW